jgi:hypothetical protein
MVGGMDSLLAYVCGTCPYGMVKTIQYITKSVEPTGSKYCSFNPISKFVKAYLDFAIPSRNNVA